MGFVAGTVPASIDEDEPMILAQCLDIAVEIPPSEAMGESMLEYKGRPFALDLIVVTDTPMVGMRHTLSSGFYRFPVGLLAVPRMFRGEVSTVTCP
jgi:hypothetical protein